MKSSKANRIPQWHSMSFIFSFISRLYNYYSFYYTLKEEEETKRQTPPTPPQELVERYPVNSGKLKKRRKRKQQFSKSENYCFPFPSAAIKKALGDYL